MYIVVIFTAVICLVVIFTDIFLGLCLGERARNRNTTRAMQSDDESAGDWDSDDTESTREEDKIYPLTEVSISAMMCSFHIFIS